MQQQQLFRGLVFGGAGTVDTAKEQLNALKDKVVQYEATEGSLVDKIGQVRANANSEIGKANTKIEDLKSQLDTANATINDLNTQINTLTKEKASVRR